MLVVFSAIFVADTKIIFRYDFVAPLSKTKKHFYLVYLTLLIKFLYFARELKYLFKYYYD